MIVNTEVLPSILNTYLKADLVCLVTGPPAVGKSSIILQVAKQNNLKVIDVRLAQADPTDMNGIPMRDDSTGKASFMPFDTFPIEGDPLPTKPDGTKYAGWLLFLDELTSAPRSVEAAAFKLILDRMVGQHKLHSHVRIIAAGNRLQDKGIVNPMSTPMKSRLAHVEVEVEPKAWAKWAARNSIDYRIISFIGFKPEILYNFKPTSTDNTYPSPRTWEFCNRIVNGVKDISVEMVPAIAGVVDEAAAREFYTYAQIFKSLITIPQIMQAPTTIPVPEEPSVMYALAGSIGDGLTAGNADKLMPFLERMNMEFQIMSLQTAIQKDVKAGNKQSLIKHPVVEAWIRVNSQELF